MRERMAVAGRVLTSIQNHRRPDRSDIESLRSWIDPQYRAADYDELACLVIMAELQRRWDARFLNYRESGSRG